MKSSRNDPCPCGSGKKYKHCHLNKEEVQQRQLNAAQTLGVAANHLAAGRFHIAQEICQTVLASVPESPEALNLLGRIAHQNGDYNGARKQFLAAIALNNAVPDYYNHLGLTLISSNLLAEAEQCFRDAVCYAPSADASNNLGSVLQRQGRIPEAIECYRDAVKLNPQNADMWNNLGAALQIVRLNDEAESCFKHVIALAPLNFGALLNLGNLHCSEARYTEGLRCYEQLLTSSPQQPLVYYNLANALKNLRQLEAAIAAYRNAHTIDPRFDVAFSARLATMQYVQGYSPEASYIEHRAFGQEFERGVWPRHNNAAQVERRLRVGYVSPDFRAHPVGYFIEPVLTNHDKVQVEVFCYNNSAISDGVTDRLKAKVNHWREVSALSDTDLAQQIRADGIDVLVDLAGHTGGGRMLTFAQKPSPVQATWLGYSCTTGLRAMDYFICDLHTDPIGLSEKTYCEKLLRLPDSFLCYLPSSGNLTVAPPPYQRNGYITFGSFNNPSKITPDVCALWARVLLSVPESKLFLKSKSLAQKWVRDALIVDFERLGVAADKLIFASHSASHDEHLLRYGEMDISLDTFPYNGVTTSFDALWMGVPVVTMAGKRFISRMGVSILNNLGLECLIADTADEYVHIAATLAHDGQRLNELRTGMRSRMAASPLVDAKRFTCNLERAYRDMWADWCKKENS
jgi:predicted O-linked N-acetylglucosamine transferase (SPINDLY family)